MPKMDQDRIESRVNEAANEAPVPDEVLDLVKKHLNGAMGERAFKAAEANRFAADLIAASRKLGKAEPIS